MGWTLSPKSNPHIFFGTDYQITHYKDHLYVNAMAK